MENNSFGVISSPQPRKSRGWRAMRAHAARWLMGMVAQPAVRGTRLCEGVAILAQDEGV